jgi:Fe-S-cluster-containing dehydrogenase component
MYCMTACSTYHEGSTSLSKARLHIIRHEGHALTRIEEEDELVFAFIGCHHCEEPVCALLCPSNAMKRDAETGAIVIDTHKCIGCHSCLNNCPFGAISFNDKKKEVFKCDLCKGDPQCVKFCQPRALTFQRAEEVAMEKRGKAGRKMVGGPDKGGQKHVDGGE